MKPLIDDSSAEAWRNSVINHPVLGPEYTNMQRVSNLTARGRPRSLDERLWFGEIYQEVYGYSRYGSEMLHRRFMQEASNVRKQEHAFREYLGSMATKLRTESRVNPEYNPIDLCKTAFATNGSDELSRRRRLEAMTRFMWARLLLHVDHVDSEIDVGRQATAFMSTVIERLFVPGESADAFVLAILDPETFRVKDLVLDFERRPEPPPHVEGVRKYDELPCRFVQCGDRKIAVILDDRVKDDMSRVFKMIRKGEGLDAINDKCGFSVAVFSPEDERLVYRQLETLLKRRPFQTLKTLNNVDGEERLNDGNADSSSAFKARRIIVKYGHEESGREITAEANVMSARMFFDVANSHTEENHDFYRFRQLCSAFFPFRYPRNMYGIDWREGSEHRKRLEERLALVQI